MPRSDPLFDGSLDAIVLYDAQGNVQRANEAASTMLGYPEERFAKRFRDHVVRSERNEALANFALAQNGTAHEFDTVFERKEGGSVPVLVTLQPVVARGEVTGIYAIARDATAIRSAEAALARSEQQFRSIFEYHYDAAIALTLRRTFGRVNVATEHLAGYHNEELVGMSMAQIVAPDHLTEANTSIERVLSGETVEFDSVVLRKDGTHCDVRVHAMPMMADGIVYGAFAFLKDVSHQRELERRNEELQRKLTHMAFHDSLTQLANRSLLEEHIARAIGRAKRSGELVAVHYFDLDGFKPVNDAFGHAAGDEVLCEVARRFGAVARDQDVVARVGGDEFVVLQTGATGEPAVRSLGTRLVQALKEPMMLSNGERVAIGASHGLAIYPKDGTDTFSLVRAADAAMYGTKRQQRKTGRSRRTYGD